MSDVHYCQIIFRLSLFRPIHCIAFAESGQIKALSSLSADEFYCLTGFCMLL